MHINILYLVALWCSVSAYNKYRCNRQSAIFLYRRPAYEFSLKLLQGVAKETDSHFVFSPVSTWLQMIALSEGATGITSKEIKRVTKHYDKHCFKNKLWEILWDLIWYTPENKRKSVIVIDELMAVKPSFKRKVQSLYGISVIPMNFQEPSKSMDRVNYIVRRGTDKKIGQILNKEDFDLSVLMMSDANYFQCDWLKSFDPGYTTVQSFYSNTNQQIGNVSMMNKIDYLNLMELTHLKSQVLELPCENREVSILIFLPTDKKFDDKAKEIFYHLERTNLNSIFNFYKISKPRLVNVSIPKFKQHTEIKNLPKLLYDMGIRRVFDPVRAQLKGISEYKMHVSSIKQISKIDFNESGVVAEVESLVKKDSTIEFTVNRPFAYMVVHRETHFILYAGVYSKPSVV